LINVSESALPSVSVETLLKRYKVEKRRKKWEPFYQRLLADADQLCTPAYLYDVFSVAELPELFRWLPGDTAAVALALCTLGDQIEGRIRDVAQHNLVSAVILEEIALALITAFTRQIHASIGNYACARGLKTGPAYRPGVGRWPLETQGTVFVRLPARDIGVTLNEQLWMTPAKSTSLIIPLLDRNQSREIGGGQ
jgi:hypothetical protein